MAYSDDLAALKLYQDPNVSLEEKLRRLSEQSAAPAPLADLYSVEQDRGGAPVDQRVAGPGDGSGGAPSGSATLPTSVQQPTAAPGGLPPTAAEIQADPALSPVEKEQIVARQAAQAGTAAAPTGATKLASDTGVTEPPRGPGDYRGALRLFQGGGGRAPVPTETVREEVQTQKGSLNPEVNQEITAHQEAGDTAGIQAQTAQVGIDQSAARIRLEAEQKAQAEQEAATAIRNETVARMQALRDKQDRISKEIAETPPEHPTLWSGQNFGGNLMTALGVALYGMGGNDPMALTNSLIQREADRQAKNVAAKRGAIDQYGTIMERAMANYGDIELAKKQTIVDLLGKAELETQKMALPGMSDIQIQRIKEQTEKLHAQRLAAEADRDRTLGDKTTSSASVQYVQARQKAQQAAAAPAPAAPGAIPARGAPAQPGAVNPASMTKPASPEEAYDQGRKLWEGGHPREALALLPPSTRAAIEAQAKRSVKGLGSGATHEDALAYALNDALGWQVPQEFIPQSARDKLVSLPGGRHGFAASAEAAKTTEQALTADNSLIGTYGLLLNLANKPSSKWSPAEREQLATFSTMIKPALSVSNGQGALSEPEQALYSAPSGGDINTMKDWLLGTGAAAAKAGLQVAKVRRRQRIRTLSSDPFDFKPLGEAE